VASLDEHSAAIGRKGRYALTSLTQASVLSAGRGRSA